MAIFHPNFFKYLEQTIFKGITKFDAANDPVLALSTMAELGLFETNSFAFSERLIQRVSKSYSTFGFLGVVREYFDNQIIDNQIDTDTERKIFILKKANPELPSTTAAIIINGFGHQLTSTQIMTVYKSHGLSNQQKEIIGIDFAEINHRVSQLVLMLKIIEDEQTRNQIQYRFLSWLQYYDGEDKNKRFYQDNKSRTLLYHYTDNVSRLGMLGLFDKDKKVFKESKISARHEAKMVITKLEHPEYNESWFLNYLKHNGLKVRHGTVSNIFKRWRIDTYKSAFVSNLARLEKPAIIVNPEITTVLPVVEYQRQINLNYSCFFKGLRNNPCLIASPGLLVIWYYLEEIGIYPLLKSFNLTQVSKIYSWADFFLYTIARIFCGIPTYSASCVVEEPSIPFFSGLIKPPCAAKLLEGLNTISDQTLLSIQLQLITRLKDLGLISGKKIAFDFHQIDLDVDHELLRDFGKAPSPKKKICYSGFRPHIAWDIETKNLIVAEFRKSSARGTTAIKRFVNELMMPCFKDVFEHVYVDSEYTGQDVWNYILDNEKGMGANLTACLKQNPLVKKKRDEFLLVNKSNEDFWKYYDDKHVYSANTFKLSWDYQNPNTQTTSQLNLSVVVKKNIKTGKLRCFGSSATDDAKQILSDYRNRWVIENGIKDLVNSFFLDKVPGTKPNLVNVHFFIVSVCKQIFSLMQRDIPALVNNKDNTMKTLQTIRMNLINQGGAKLKLNDHTLEVQYQNAFSPELTQVLTDFYGKVTENANKELKLMGGIKVKFCLQPPHGEEHKNSHKTVNFDPKNF